jgi:hypothetical protein
MLTYLPIFVLSAFGLIQVDYKWPDIDIARECRSETQDGSGYDLNHCIADETEARQQIQNESASFAAEDRRQCVGETTSTPDERSYVELLVCLEMARDVRRGEADGPQQQHRKPDSQ